MLPGGLANFNPIAHGGDFQRTGSTSMQQSSGQYYGNLPTVSDPEKTYANITKQQHFDYIRDFRGFEQGLIDKAQTDTSLIEGAREDATKQSAISRGIQQRNLERYGTDLTPAQRQEMERANQRGAQTGLAGGVNNARIQQEEANRRMLADLINIGQGVNRSSLGQMQSAAQDANARKQAYKNAKAQSKAQNYSMVGSLGAAAILAFAI